MASMGIYVFSRDMLLDMLERESGLDFGRELIPERARTSTGCKPYLYRGYWADVGTIESFYDANVMLGRRGRAVPLLGPDAADLHAPAPPARLAADRLPRARLDRRPTAASSIAATSTESVVGIRTHIEAGAQVDAVGAARRGLLRGRRGHPTACPPLGIGRDVVLDRAIIDKNARIGDGARLVNEAQRRPRRRRRLVHPRRHHRRAEGRRHSAGDVV